MPRVPRRVVEGWNSYYPSPLTETRENAASLFLYFLIPQRFVVLAFHIC